MISELLPVYADHIPIIKQNGKIYISMKHSIAIHLCACGCGHESVTPLGKEEWTINENDGKITLRPSIGNFNGENPYHAHYFITNNKIEWC